MTFTCHFFPFQLHELAEEMDLDNKTLIMIYLEELKSSSDSSRLENPSDLAADIEAVRLLIKVQDNTLNQSKHTNLSYPSYDDTIQFAKVGQAQYMHYRLHANYFLSPWEIPGKK